MTRDSSAMRHEGRGIRALGLRSLTYIEPQCIRLLSMDMTKDLVAASATPLVLAILAEGDSYGYAIIARAELSGGTAVDRRHALSRVAPARAPGSCRGEASASERPQAELLPITTAGAARRPAAVAGRGRACGASG